MRILTIFTGGTIGSSIDGNGRIATEEKTKYLLLQMYEEKYEKQGEGTAGDKITFCTLEPYRILSENLQGKYLEQLVQVLHKELEKEYDGIVITHGTDTLQYTAAALQYLFADAKIPIVLVSAAYVLTDERTNGLVNFAAAVDFIKEKQGTGVFVSYCNEKDVPRIHRGTRLQNALTFSADISSICQGEYGYFLEGKFVKNDQYLREHTENKKRLPVNRECVKFDQNAKIIRMHAYPGMQYPGMLYFGMLNSHAQMQGFEGDCHVKAVLYESYHSGTICICSELQEFAKQMKERNIPIFVTGLNAAEAEYETVEMFRKMGLIAIENKAPIAQYVKLWIACSNGLDVRTIMQENYGEE